MRIARLGKVGAERPAVVIGDEAVFVDSIITDWTRGELERGALERVRGADFSQLPRTPLVGVRLGSPVARPTKVICVGLNYLQHIAETNATKPQEPIVFMKVPDTVIGPSDDIVIPPGSTATDYEVELAIVIGRGVTYLKSPEDAPNYILGFAISQDVSERHWQLERSGQWVKGKSFPTFNPIGPFIVTTDEIDASDLRIWCKVDDEMRQDSRTSDLLFGINYLVWYISQFMELCPGDIINSGTPNGVGLGHTPPKYLRAGQTVTTGIEGIGEIQSRVVAYVR